MAGRPSNGYFNRTEQQMLEVLKDGELHSREELHACLYDDAGPLSNIQVHICNLRKKLEPRRLDIVCIRRGSGPFAYRLVRLITTAEY